MRKPFRRWFAFLAITGMSVSAASMLQVNASDVIYDDSNVSIISAVDRYIATNEDGVADIIDNYQNPVINQKKEELATGGATVTITENKPEGSKEENKATGSVQVSNITGEITVVGAVDQNKEEKVESTTEQATTTESTTEATSQNTSSDNKQPDGFVFALTEPDMTGRAVVTASDSVNIRESGDVSSKRVGNISQGGILTVVERGSEWSLVTSGSVKGYIKNEFIAFDGDAATYASSNLKKVVMINTASLRVREYANEKSEAITLVNQGNCYGIVEVGAGWTKIQVDDSTSGYVRNDYIKLDYTGAIAQPVNDAPANNSGSTSTESAPSGGGITTAPSTNIGVDIANYALQFVGNPYVYGGTSLTNGADCSGFVMTIYKNYGYSIPRTADVQGTVGTEVSLSALAPGDLVFYDHGTGSIKHVAMYIGNGQVVHASSSTTGIIVSNTNYSTPCKAVRIIN